MHKVTAIYFSPTGGSRKYAQAIAGALDEDYRSIDFTDFETRNRVYTFGPEDLVVFGAPVYAGRLPLPEDDLFGRIKGENTPAVFTVTYGNREFDDALLEMQEVLEAKGFKGVGAAAFLAEHTYSVKLAGGRPDEADLAQAADFGKNIKALLERVEDREEMRLQIPGNHPYKEAKHLPMHTETGERCSECGFCADICPTHAISKAAGMEEDPEKCIGCLACVKRCPRGGRLVNDPGLAAIREKLEPNFGGIRKEHQFFAIDR